MPSSYNGWPASKSPAAIGIDPNWSVLGHKFPGGVKAGDVATVFTWLAHQLHTRVEPLDRDAVKDDWGYSYKHSANSPDLISCHASGTAIDWNATRHPNGHRGTFTAYQAAAIRAICREAGVIRWLGDATRTPDEMHFEIHGDASEVAAAAKRLSSITPPDDGDDDMAGEGPEILAYVKGMNDKIDAQNKTLERMQQELDSIKAAVKG